MVGCTSVAVLCKLCSYFLTPSGRNVGAGRFQYIICPRERLLFAFCRVLKSAGTARYSLSPCSALAWLKVTLAAVTVLVATYLSLKLASKNWSRNVTRRFGMGYSSTVLIPQAPVWLVGPLPLVVDSWSLIFILRIVPSIY